MDIYEITGYPLGIDNSGVNFLSPIYAFSDIENGFVYRQILQSRLGFTQFANRLSDGSRVMGIFEFLMRDGSKELLVTSKEFLYRWNSGTNVFDQIANVGFVSFGIVANNGYISGTAYPDKTGADRFIFTGSAMSAIYLYDGTNVTLFTASADYAPPAAGALTKAKYVAYFGERLNFLSPVIAGFEQPQTVLYSGIRSGTGNGDKFNVAGSGTAVADNYEYMTGMVIPGDYMLVNFNRSNWTLEKTRDAFNPYFFRKVPGVLGTDASFSAVCWNNQTESVGKTGVIVSDGRTTLRSDNKIPYLTADGINQVAFDLTYGGFDRINDQFLYAYAASGSDLSLATGTQDNVLVHNYKEDTWAINTQRFSVFGQTDKGQDLTWGEIDEIQNPSWGRMDTTEELWGQIGLGQSVQKTLAGDNLGFVYQLNQDSDDYFVTITNITQASSAVITVDPCALQINDVVTFENVVGMTEINGLTATILAIGTTSGATTSITVNVDSSLFTAYSSGGSVSKIIEFSATLAPFNPYRDQGRKVWVSHVEFLINTDGSLLVDVFEDEEENPFKSNVLLQTVPSTKSKQWISMTVNQESNFITLEMSQKSASEQVKITSIRVHCQPGGLTTS